jgi:hypothetical protein
MIAISTGAKIFQEAMDLSMLILANYVFERSARNTACAFVFAVVFAVMIL